MHEYSRLTALHIGMVVRALTTVAADQLRKCAKPQTRLLASGS